MFSSLEGSTYSFQMFLQKNTNPFIGFGRTMKITTYKWIRSRNRLNLARFLARFNLWIRIG